MTRAVCCLTAFRNVNIMSGTHNRENLRSAFMELVSILGHENDESLKSSSTYLMLISSIQNGIMSGERCRKIGISRFYVFKSFSCSDLSCTSIDMAG